MKELVKLARKAIESYFTGEDINLPENFYQKQGVFVTLKKRGNLRGCIGFPMPVMPLREAVVKAARAAAFEDPRFPPLREEELKDIDIEVSVLTLPEIIKAEKPEDILKSIEIGRDGLIIEYNGFSGLLLPQVPLEWNWNKREFLENLCLKAGLPKDAWKLPGIKISKFQAKIIKE